MTKRGVVGICVAAVAVSLFSGCATIMSGKQQKISITSYPDGAAVSINGREVCGATPCVVPLDRSKDSVTVKVTKPGYEPAVREIGTDMNGWLLGNIIFGGLPGTTTDAVSGSMYKYDVNTLHVELHKKED